MTADSVSIDVGGDTVSVTDGLVTIEPRRGRLARRRSRLDGSVTWPAPRTTVTLVRTETLGQWQASLTYEGQTVVVVPAQKRLEALTEFADRHLGGMTNSIMDAERDRQARRSAE